MRNKNSFLIIQYIHKPLNIIRSIHLHGRLIISFFPSVHFSRVHLILNGTDKKNKLTIKDSVGENIVLREKI